MIVMPQCQMHVPDSMIPLENCASFILLYTSYQFIILHPCVAGCPCGIQMSSPCHFLLRLVGTLQLQVPMFAAMVCTQELELWICL